MRERRHSTRQLLQLCDEIERLLEDPSKAELHISERIPRCAAAFLCPESGFIGLVVADLGLLSLRLASWHEADLSLANGTALSRRLLFRLHVLGARTE